MSRTQPAEIEVPRHEIRFRYARSSGPGGQNVNKVESRATLRWSVRTSRAIPAEVRARFTERFASRLTASGELLITSQRFRDRARNEEDCLERLRAMLRAVATPPRARRPTRPGRGAVERRLAAKRAHAERKARRSNPRRSPSSWS